MTTMIQMVNYLMVHRVTPYYNTTIKRWYLILFFSFFIFCFSSFRFVDELEINLGLDALDGDLLRAFEGALAGTVSVAAPGAQS